SRIAFAENRLKQKELALSQKIEELQRSKKEVDAIRENLTLQTEIVEKKHEELDMVHKQQIEYLEAMSGITADEAKTQLTESLKAEAKTEAMSFVNEAMEEAKMTAGKEAKRIVIQTIQRVATE